MGVIHHEQGAAVEFDQGPDVFQENVPDLSAAGRKFDLVLELSQLLDLVDQLNECGLVFVHGGPSKRNCDRSKQNGSDRMDHITANAAAKA